MLPEAQDLYLAAAKAFAAIQHLFPHGQDVVFRVSVADEEAFKNEIDESQGTWWSLVRAEVPRCHAAVLEAEPRLMMVRWTLRQCGLLVRDADIRSLRGPEFDMYRLLLTEVLDSTWVAGNKICFEGETAARAAVLQVLSPHGYLLERMCDVIRHYAPTPKVEKKSNDSDRDQYQELGELAVEFPEGSAQPGMRVLVMGNLHLLKSTQQVELITKLINVGASGLTYAEAKKIHTHAGQCLKALAGSHSDWKAAIELPADTGGRGGYRIRNRAEAKRLHAGEVGGK